MLDGNPMPEEDIRLLKETARKIGYPLFMRNDLTSGKHNYLNNCYVPDEASIIQHVFNIVEDAACKDQAMTSIVLREYLRLDSKFKAFGGLPVAPERRYFIRQGKITCHHPYWIQDAIEFWAKYDRPDNWESLLSEMNTETEPEIALLSGYAEKIVAVLEGDWSLDFAKGKNGLWYFIDAAEYNLSWHPDCPNNPNPEKEAKRKKRLKTFPLWYKI
jgi:hypothetical protein